MKTNRIYGILLCSALFIACSKDKKDTTPTPVPTPVPVSNVSIAGVTDTITRQIGGTVYQSIMIKQDSGDNEQVNLSSSGLPATINISFTPDSGRAPFGSIMVTNVDDNASAGYFKGKLVAKNKAGATKTKDIVIHTFEDCEAYIYGNWTRTITYSDGTTYGPMNVYFTFNGPYKSDGFGLNYYELNCESGTIKLVTSQFDRYSGSEIYGSGTITKSKITIDGFLRYNSSESFKPVKIEYTPR